jgi:hypothetical protein
MERIGIAASRMAKGKLWLYNFFVIFISFLFSLVIFIVAGLSIFLGLVVVSLIIARGSGISFSDRVVVLLPMCLTTLTVLVACFNLAAIGRNIKLKK